MPSVYDFRHVELDKVGRGKRVIKAPGGGSSNIFAAGEAGRQQQLNGNGSCSETESVDGSVLSCPSTPVHHHNGNGNGSAFGYESDTSSTPSSAASSRRGSLAETKNRLFGQQEVPESPRRRVVDRMKSNIFAEPDPAPIVRTPSVKKYEHVVNRNPITGEVYAAAPPASGVITSGVPMAATNGNIINGQQQATIPVNVVTNGNGAVNGVNGSASMPNTPVRVRQPPGGKSSNIFG